MSSFEGLGPLPPLVDCDSDSDSDDEGESLQERRARWRRTLDDLAEEAEQMLLGRGGLREPSGLAGPPRQKRRAYEAPGSRDARFSHLFQRKDERFRRFDHNKSLWWDDLNHPEVYNESSGAGRRFRRKFCMPKVVVDKLVTEASKQPHWAVKPHGGLAMAGVRPGSPLEVRRVTAIRAMRAALSPSPSPSLPSSAMRAPQRRRWPPQPATGPPQPATARH